jgi:sigma-E factor negative regulatory protein RseB
MKHRLFLVAFISSLLVTCEVIANAEIEESPVNNESQQQHQTALSYLENMKQAYKALNYELLYINTGENKVEPKQLIHGVVDGKRITYFCFLNGAMRESLQFDGKISFYEQGNQAYSLATERDQGVFANIANFDFDSGSESYEYIILGKGRIAGKKAIAIRMISKDEFRYSYIVWLDLNSYLPLRLDTISKSNLIIDQTMAISLNVTETINPWVAELSYKKIPEVLHLPKMVIDEVAQWQINWLPEGFKIIKDDQHKLMMHDTEPVSYIMLSDGIVTASIYISTNKSSTTEQKSIIQRGGTLLYTKQQGNIEVNIIGDIPVATAERMAASIRIND